MFGQSSSHELTFGIELGLIEIQDVIKTSYRSDIGQPSGLTCPKIYLACDFPSTISLASFSNGNIKKIRIRPHLDNLHLIN